MIKEWDLVADLEMEFEKKEINLFTIYVTANPWEPEKLHAFLREKSAGRRERPQRRSGGRLSHARLGIHAFPWSAIFVEPSDDVHIEQIC